MNNKKIIFISGTFPPTVCGVGIYSYKLLEELSKDENFEIHLITSDIENLKGIDNIEIHRVNREWSIKTFNQIIDIIKEINPDIIHFQHPTLAYQFRFDTFILGLKLKNNFPKIPKIITEHELSQANPIAKIRNLTILPFFDYIIFTNNNDFNYFKRLRIFHYKKIKVIPIFPTNYYPFKIEKKQYFCFIGTLDKKKGFEYILDAIKLLKINNIEIKLNILTQFNPQRHKYHRTIQEKIKKLNLGKNIVFNNPMNGKEIAKKIAQSFGVIIPFNLGVSERNTTFLEAISYGKPIITTKSKYTPISVFINNENCILIKPKNSNLIAKNIIKLLTNKDFYNKISKGAFDLSKEYTVKKTTTEYIKLYKKLI